MTPRWSRILLKLSGEALAGSRGFGFDPGTIKAIATEIAEGAALGVQIGVVVGGGNILRGAIAADTGLDRVTADSVGMLGTIQNGLFIRDALRAIGARATTFSAIPLGGLALPYDPAAAVEALQSGSIGLFAGGTGNPYFSTDTAAALRALETRSQALLKATNVDGIYDSDPRTNENATRFESVSYSRCISDRLRVMDTAAFALCEEHSLPIVVFKLGEGHLARVLRDEAVGTVVGRDT